MKFLFTLSLITSIAFGQNNASVMDSIKKQFLEIEELLRNRELIEKEIEYSCKDLSIIGYVTFYFQNQDLKLITHSFDQGHYSSTNKYYISDNTLFFYFSSKGADNGESIYDENNGGLIDVREDWSISELRIYFNKGKALKCMVKQYENEDVTNEIREKYPGLSDYFLNEKIDCDPAKTKEILIIYFKLKEFQNLDIESMCKLH